MGGKKVKTDPGTKGAFGQKSVPVVGPPPKEKSPLGKGKKK